MSGRKELIRYIEEKIYEQEKGIEVDKRKIKLDVPVSSLGTTNVEVDLYKGQVIGTIHVHVSQKG